MAAADATLPPLAPVPARRILARSGFAVVAADAVICTFLASLWVHFGAGVATAVGSLACDGDDCRAVDVALQVMSVAGKSFTLVSPVAIALLLLVVGLSSLSSKTELKEEKARSFASVAQELLCDPVMIGFLVSWTFVLPMMAGYLLNDRIGALISYLGFLGLHALYFFIILPIVALRVWRLWRAIRPRQ